MEIPIETVDDLEADQYQMGEKKESFGICKAGDINEEERSVIAIISTDSIDRDNEVLVPKGMDADNFRKNPLVLWSHNAGQPPIAKALWLKQGRKRITAKIKFAMTDRAEEVWQLMKGGFLNAFSVGFKPKEGRRPTPDDIKGNPNLADVQFIFSKWELLEFSVVGVPANAEALALAVKSKSITLSDDMIETLEVKEVKEVEEDEEILVCASDFREKAIPVRIPVREVIEVREIK